LHQGFAARIYKIFGHCGKFLPISALFTIPVNADDEPYSSKDWELSHGRYKKFVKYVKTIPS
jgi:hypothetical protein